METLEARVLILELWPHLKAPAWFWGQRWEAAAVFWWCVNTIGWKRDVSNQYWTIIWVNWIQCSSPFMRMSLNIAISQWTRDSETKARRQQTTADTCRHQRERTWFCAALASEAYPIWTVSLSIFSFNPTRLSLGTICHFQHHVSGHTERNTAHWPEFHVNRKMQRENNNWRHARLQVCKAET